MSSEPRNWWNNCNRAGFASARSININRSSVSSCRTDFIRSSPQKRLACGRSRRAFSNTREGPADERSARLIRSWPRRARFRAAIASSSALPKASEFHVVVWQVLTLVEWIPACRPQSRIVDLSAQCCEVLEYRSSEHPCYTHGFQAATLNDDLGLQHGLGWQFPNSCR